jgi:flagellin
MPSYINTNIASINTQRNLTTSQSSLNISIQRLSSGLRVNSAKDDAAGLSIATRMDSQIKGQTVAMRNANDAISYAQTAEGALGKITDSLQRMRELAVQSANATNSGADRSNLDKEFTQLQDEVTRLTNNTKFNGASVLGEAAGAATVTKTFQVGADTTDTIDITSNNLSQATSQTAIAATRAYSLNVVGDMSQAENDAAVARFTAAGGTVTATTMTAGSTNATTGVITPGTVTAGAITAGGTATAADIAVVQANINANVAAAQAAAKLDPAATLVDNADGKAATLTSTVATASSAFTAAQKTSLTNAGTAADAEAAITQLDAALTEINTERANVGAVQNRFSSVIGNLQVSVENQSASRSRIMDADFANETANLARGQILQQAGTAMLAQANSMPNGVLALLR